MTGGWRGESYGRVKSLRLGTTVVYSQASRGKEHELFLMPIAFALLYHVDATHTLPVIGGVLLGRA